MKQFVLILILFPLFLFGQKMTDKNKETTKTILFVCEHGAAKSVVAAAYFNRLAEEKGLNYKTVFRGTKPDSLLSAGTIKGLKMDLRSRNGNLNKFQKKT